MARPTRSAVDRDHLPTQPLRLPVDDEEHEQETGDDSPPGANPEHGRPGDGERLAKDKEQLETPQGRTSL